MGFLASVGTVGFSVSAPSLVPSLVGPQHLATANGRLELARSMAFAGGPALAGALIAWMGASTSFVLSLMMSLAAVGFLSQIQEPSRQSAPDRHPWLELKDGANFVWASQLSCVPSCSHQSHGIFLGLFCKPFMCLMPLHTLGMGSSEVGLTIGLLWRGHDRRLLDGGSHGFCHAFWYGHFAGAIFLRPRSDCHGFNHLLSLRWRGGLGLLSVWIWSHHLDHHIHHFASKCHAQRHDGPGHGHHHGGWHWCKRPIGALLGAFVGEWARTLPVFVGSDGLLVFKPL